MSAVPASIPFEVFADAVLAEVTSELSVARSQANLVRLSNDGLSHSESLVYFSERVVRLRGFGMVVSRMKLAAPGDVDFDAIEIEIQSAINEIKFLSYRYLAAPLLERVSAFGRGERAR